MIAPFKPFEQMTPEDYAEIGLRCGLEVHQQLLTDRKLFCRCPAGRYGQAYDAEILRHMRPTLSELGEYDGTALMEKKTRKNIHYRIHHDTVCTYEFDDTPPFLIDDKALDIAIELALLLKLNRVSELHIARKQYLDGSIPAGFQRTTILGVDGWIPYKDRRIHIVQLGFEEDSCREVSDRGHDRVYLTDRLGMPLIEVVTAPDMNTPQEAAEVGQIIRRLCRSTRKVRTGYGAARQDVNVSVTGGTRVEIKGVPQLTRVPHQIYSEARRQWTLLHIRDELKQRGVTPETLEASSADVTGIVAKTLYQPIRTAIDEGHRVRCVALKRFDGLLQQETQEHTTFAKEFSDRVRVIACLTNLPNLVHSDIASESLYGKDWKRLRKRMKAEPEDALLLVWGSEADARCACEEIIIRAREATIGIPSDTRQALKDGTNGFERVLPGAERMYPDTDLPPLPIEPARVERIAAQLPVYVWDREAKYRAMGLNEELVMPLAASTRADLFETLVENLKIRPTLAAVVLCQRLKAMRRAGLHPDDLSDEAIHSVFAAYADGRLAREGIFRVLQWLLKQEPDDALDAGQAIKALGFAPLSDAKLSTEAATRVARIDHGRFESNDQKHRTIVGSLMHEHLGCAEGARVAELVAASLDADRSEPEQAKVGA